MLSFDVTARFSSGKTSLVALLVTLDWAVAFVLYDTVVVLFSDGISSDAEPIPGLSLRSVISSVDVPEAKCDNIISSVDRCLLILAVDVSL